MNSVEYEFLLESKDVYILYHQIVFVPLGVVGLFMLYPAYFYYTRRHIYPLSMRKPLLSFLSSCCVLGYILFVCIAWSISEYLSAFIFDLLYSFFLLMSAFLYLWRAWILYFLSRLAIENAIEVHLAAEEVSTSTFFQRRRYLIKTSFLLRLGSILFCLFSLPSVYFAIRSPAYRNTPLIWAEFSSESQVVQRANQLFIFIFVVLFSLVAFKLRSVGKDAFGIRAELARCAQCMVIGFIVFNFMQIVITPLLKFGLSTSSVVVSLLFVLTFSLIVPLKASYVGLHLESKTDVQRGVSRLSTSRDLARRSVFEIFFLFSQEGYEAFVNFSQSEFSIENIIFWKRCLQFRGSRRAAVEIYKLFIERDSPLQVNLSSKTQKFYKEAISKGSSSGAISRKSSSIAPSASSDYDPHLFDIAVSEVLRLMEFDTFPRFLQYQKHREIWKDYLMAQAQEKMLTNYIGQTSRAIDLQPSNFEGCGS